MPTEPDTLSSRQSHTRQIALPANTHYREEGAVLLIRQQAIAAWHAGYVRLAQLIVQPSEVGLEAVLSILGALPRRELLAAGPLRKLVAGELTWHAARPASLHISACAA